MMWIIQNMSLVKCMKTRNKREIHSAALHSELTTCSSRSANSFEYQTFVFL
jgi:hypothetical protein